MITAGTAELLRRTAFFGDLDEDALMFVAGCCTNVRFDPGEYLLREGQPADVFYIVRTGRVAIETASPDRGVLVLDLVGPEEVVGISWLSPPYRCQFDARATELTRALRVDAACLRRKCEEEPRLGYRLMQAVAAVMRQRLQSARIRLLDLYHAPTR